MTGAATRVLAAGLSALTIGAADAQPASGPGAGLGIPSVPTTRVLAIGHLTASASLDAMKAVMASEVRDTLRLYLGGRLEQWYARKDQPGIVFILDVTDVREAHDLLEALPLGKAGLMAFELIPVGPLAPLGLLLSTLPGEVTR